MESNKIDYSKLVYKSGDKKYFDFTRFGPLSSFYLKLINGNIGNNVVKLNMKKLKKEINRLEEKKTKKQPYKKNKEDVVKNAESLYKGLEIIVNAFEKLIFEYGGLPEIDVDYESDSDTYYLTNKEFQMFKNFFRYDDPNKLRDTFMDADEKECDKFLNDLKVKQNVLNKQIKTEIRVKRTSLENLVHAVKNVLDYVTRRRGDDLISVEMPDLESEKSTTKQRRNQKEQGLKKHQTKCLVDYQFL